MPQGKIKKVVSEKGFGFIEGPDGKDVFFHHSIVEQPGFDELRQGQEVDFEVDAEGSKGKGPRAKYVKPI